MIVCGHLQEELVEALVEASQMKVSKQRRATHSPVTRANSVHACVESPEGGGEGDGASYDEYGYGGGGDDYGGYRGYGAHADPEIDPAKFLVEGVCMLVSVLCHCAAAGQGG